MDFGGVTKLFFFLCSDARDRASLIDLSTANFQGALILFTKCVPQDSFRDHSFLRMPIWIKVERLPLLYNKVSVAQRALEKLGRVLYFDDDSTSEGFKDYLRAKVIIPINNPLVPGVFFNRQEGPRIWIDFRYEGVFVYCNKCGRIGHRRARCRIPFATAQRHFEMVLEDIGQGVHLHITSQNDIPLFTNKLIGLKRVERNRTSAINLVDYAGGRDKEGDSHSEHTIQDDVNDDGSDSSGSSGGGDHPSQGNGNEDNSPSQRDNGDHHYHGKFPPSYPTEAGSSKTKRSSEHPYDELHQTMKLDHQSKK